MRDFAADTMSWKRRHTGIGTGRRGLACGSALLAVLATMLLGTAHAQTPTASQAEAFRNLSPQQQRALMEQMGVNTQDVLPYTTKTFGAGSGTVVTTEAALSFQPGVAFSAPHLSSYSYPGDYIKISNNPITQVLSVDPANNQITIADAQGWLSGASIHLTDGTNILNDLGACQNGALPQVPVQPVGGLV